jgi:diguanylate cyclase (GGDEF)-like protein
MTVPWPRRDARSAGVGASSSFEDAARVVASLLVDRTGFSLWVVTRSDGGLRIASSAATPGIDTASGELLDWAGSLGAGLLAGGRPVAEPDASNVDLAGVEHVATPAEGFVLGSFIGVPLRGPGGVVVGALCGFDPEPCGSDLSEEQRLVEVFGSLLSSILSLELASDEAKLQAVEAMEHSQRDALTGVLNRAGWDQALEREAKRCRALGQGASVLVIDLDDLKGMNDRYGHAYGDDQIRGLADSITGAARSEDVVARLGGDEFALLAPGSAPGTADELARRLRAEFERRAIPASIGAAECPPTGDLVEAWRRADVEMYASKRLAHAAIGQPPSGAPTQLGDVVAAAAILARVPCQVLRSVIRVAQGR